MKLISPQLRSRLAAEYVLGTLQGAARRRLQQFLQADYALRVEVAQWEADLTPLTARLKPVNPSARVWTNIQARIGGRALPTSVGWLDNLKLWRGLGLVSSTLATILFVTVLTVKGGGVADDPMMMAVLEDNGVARMVVEQPKSGYLMVKVIKPWQAAADKSMELWVIGKDGVPHSLGIINDSGDTKLSMPDMDHRLTDGTMFAISKEARGGSTTGVPGTVICKGTIARMPLKPEQKSRPQI